MKVRLHHALLRASALTTATLLTLALAGCNGTGGSGPASATADAADNGSTRVRALATTETAAWVTLPSIADPLMQNLNIPADAPTRGMWSGSRPWPLNAIHAILMADGRLLTFGTPFNNATAQDGRFYDIWSPSLGFAAGSHAASTVPDPVNSFCGTSGWLADGRLLVSGGNGGGGKSSGLFSTVNSTATADGAFLAAERWYASMLSLPDGRNLILGGTVPYAKPVSSQTPEIYEGGRWRSLMGASSTPIFGVSQLGNQPEANPWYYPRAWVAPDGSVFGITSNIMFRMRPDDNAGSGSITQVGTFKTVQDSSSATRPNVGFTSTAVMFAPGRILQVGGNGITDNNPNQASELATIVDINGSTPVLSETAPMANRRHWANATVLADGKVVVTGGTTVGWDAANAVRPAEIWNPVTGTWTTGASNVETRTYHSSALLLPNGTVFTGGGGAPGAVNNLNAEIYYPPQLFTSVNGVAQLAKRPVLQAISTLKAAVGGNLGLQLGDSTALSQVSLVALGSTTHSYNNTQRRIPLSFTQTGSLVTATLPASANVVPPGYYMVFAVDQAGVPSRGTIIAVGDRPAPAINGVSAPPATAVACGGENATCTIPAGQKASVYYGANASFTVRTSLTGAVSCSNATFGDPAPGLAKSCSYVIETVPNTVPAVNAAPVAVGASSTYTVAAAAGASYSWSFGDGSPATAFSTSPTVTRSYAAAGVYNASLTVRWSDGSVSTRSFLQAVVTPATAGRPVASGATGLETRANASARLWVANPDADTVAVIDTASNARVAEIAVGTSPRSVAVAPDGRIWVTNKGSATISIINPGTLAVAATVNLPRAAQPHGLVFAPGGSAFVVLEATGQLLKLDPASGATQATLAVGANPRHLSVTGDGATVLVSRFITNPLPGEATAAVDTTTAGGEVLAVNAATMTINRSIVLRHSDKVDSEAQGSGIPNYLAAAVVSPDGRSAWVPSKQDNIKRGTLRNGQGLNFQNAVRAISSRIDLATLAEDYPRRIDHDNSSLGSAAAFHPSGAYLFVALETSRQVAVVDAAGGRELARFDVGRAPQAISVSADGTRLYVQNFMDRSVSVLDLAPLATQGLLELPLLANVGTVGAEKLPAQVLLGKQLFYDARDPRLARDSYMSCASCHSDAGHDGRTWDFTGFGEGLRNTPALKGRAGTGQGFVHWSANFDEIQDFEGQIRNFAGGTGLMPDAQFNAGTRNQPLGDKKAGISADLDALAAYLASLNSFDDSPWRQADGTQTAAAQAGQTVFANANCASCHGGAGLTSSADAAALKNIGTQKPASGQRLGAALNGIDIPTLRDVWRTAPYLHDGSAPTLAAAVQAHAGNTVAGTDLNNLVAYLQQLGAAAPVALGAWTLNEGTGTTAADSSGSNRPLALSNTGWVAGRFGQAAQFNGTTSSGSAAGPILNTAQSFTVSAWVKLDALTGWRTFVNQDGTNISGFWLQYSEFVGNKFALSMHDVDSTTSNALRAVGTTTPVVGQWYHVVGVRDKAAGTMRLYVNGKLEGTTAYAGGWAANGTLNIGRGRFGGPGDWFAGAIDEVRVFGSALNDGEVAQLFATSGSGTPNVAPSVALTAPASNSTVAQGSAVMLTAAASDSDGSVARVEFYDGSTLLGTATAAPYTFNWSNPAVGAHSLTARAFDNGGASTSSAAITLNVAASVNVPPASAVACANENATCTIPAGLTATVWYGANSVWAVRTGLTGAVACTNAFFGDPLPGQVKTCRYLATSAAPGTGTGLTGSYFSNNSLAGIAVLTRTEVPWFNWGTGRPALTVPADNFSVRWTGQVQALEAGSYQFRTNSDDGVRVWVNGVQIINNWTAHAPTVDTSTAVTLAAGQRVSITIEYQEFTGGAVLELSWLRPGGAWTAVPAQQLYR